MTSAEKRQLERVAAGVPFDGPKAVRDWLATLTAEQRTVAESFYRRLAQAARERGLI